MPITLSDSFIDKMSLVIASQPQQLLPLHPPAAAAAVQRVIRLSEALRMQQQEQQEQQQKQEQQQQQQQQHQQQLNACIRVRRAAVLVPLCSREGEACCLFTVRSSSLTNYSNQVCFPGGIMEGRETAAAAALRETAEEIGDAGPIRILGETQPVFTLSGFILHPVIGVLLKETLLYLLRPNPAEVQAVFAVPLELLLQQQQQQQQQRQQQQQHEGEQSQQQQQQQHISSLLRLPYFLHEDQVIWG
ncbi:hypothetical protein, conserved [Eimeria praecox]|uniref:Nudix hydrolase domain-containing protein n=1 Tax=Eimeria praecox TaxID=51316 RepID=U6H3H4_9EIME|nr:hypothetical protein, conserved [Eimeria praecox]